MRLINGLNNFTVTRVWLVARKRFNVTLLNDFA